MKKKALLVGVNKYKYVGSLNGCVNDVRNMADILTSFYGFTSNEIRTIVDESATRNNLMNRLDWLIDEAQAGDLLLFHFSGHGSQVQDRDGDELEDYMDEILCLHDMDFRNPDSYLLDDDFNNIIDRLPKDVFLSICIDACHSGTATRDIELLTSELQIPPAKMKIQPRFLEPPADIALRNYGKSLKVRRMGSKIKEDKRNGGLKGTAVAKHVLLSGCMDDQTSADAFLNNDYNGAFTYYLCKTIRDVKGTITYQELIKKVQGSLAFNSFSQIPQLNGNDQLKNVNFLSYPARYELTCEYGHPLVCKDGHPQKGYSISVDTKTEKAKPLKPLKPLKRFHITTRGSKQAISRDIILSSSSEFVGTVRDITEMANQKQDGSRNALGNAYNPDCLDILEDDNFGVASVLEFRPNEQRAFGADETVKPISLNIRCKPNEEAVILAFEDGIWSWHFKNNNNPNTSKAELGSRYLAVDNINSFHVPFKVQDRTTRGLWSKVVCVFKFSKDWIKKGSDEAIYNIVEKYEKEKIEEGLKVITPDKGFFEGLTETKQESDWSSVKELIKGRKKSEKKALLFIHGTASSLEGGYADVNKTILEELKVQYPIILGYDHFTLSKTPEDNAKYMLDKLKKSGLLNTGLEFDVVTHSRGGLVLRSFVELLGGNKYVDKVIMVACPAGGTNLANPNKWDSVASMINLLTNLFFFTGGAPLKIFFGLLGGLIKFASSKIKQPGTIPGVWAMNPNSSFIKDLNKKGKSINSGTATYNTIGSDFEPSGLFHGGLKDDIADNIADAFFGDPNDLIVDTGNMAVIWPKGIISGKESNFRFLPDKHVYHLNYFEQAETYRRFEKFFGLNLDTAIKESISAGQLKEKPS